MDKLINEPDEVYSQSEFNFLPYLNQYNRELFNRTNSQDLYYKLSNLVSKNTRNHQNDPRLVVHVPFSKEEHESVLKYLLLTKFYNVLDPIHSQPFQLMSALTKKEFKHGRIHRSSESILQYLSEIYIQQSTLFNADDKIIFLTSKPHTFPKKEINNQFQLAEQIKLIGMNSERSKIIKIQDILPSVVVIFITDVSPIVVDLSAGNNIRLSKYEACFLMSSSSRFLITGSPEFCSDKNRFCCFYEHGTLNFIDLKHRVKFKNKDTYIHSFKCFPYPCYEGLSKLCACTDKNEEGNMIIAAITDAQKIGAWVFHSSDRTVSRSSIDIKPSRLEWIPGQRLAVVTENQDITIIPFPWDDKEFEFQVLTMDVPHHFVECQGDAYVLEEEVLAPSIKKNNENENDNTNSVNSTAEGDGNAANESSSSNISDNEEAISFRNSLTNSGNSIILGQNHRIHIFTYDGQEFEIEIEQKIVYCAYVRENFALTTHKGEIFIFDKNVKYARTRICEYAPIFSIEPVDFNRPMFARRTKSNIKFFDNHGNTSTEYSFIDTKSPADNSLKSEPFFSKNGFLVTISNKFEMGIKWFL